MNTKVMGIVNVTPDSFSDGGQFYRPEQAIRRALNMVEDGADIIDLGGESTRPGADPVSWEEEWNRLEPVLRGLSPSLSIPIIPKLQNAPSSSVQRSSIVYTPSRLWICCKSARKAERNWYSPRKQRRPSPAGSPGLFPYISIL